MDEDAKLATNFNSNLKALEAIYPGQSNWIRSSTERKCSGTISGEEFVRFLNRELETCWDSEAELHVVDRFAGHDLARILFDRIQRENLRREKNRRLILIDDRPDRIRESFEQENWHLLIESEICLFVLSPQSESNLKRLLHRYPDIASIQPIVYRGDPDAPESRWLAIREIFLTYFRAIAKRNHDCSLQQKARTPSPYPQSIRFFMPGHNYLQDACVRSLQRMGYGAGRLQWKNPLNRFVRSSAWMIELYQNPFDMALFLNATPKSFGATAALNQTSLRKAAWFVDHPRRYGFEPTDFESLDVIGVFDRAYIPFLQERCKSRIVEVRTGFGIDPTAIIHPHEFSNIDIAFVGELGARGFLALELGFQKMDPSLLNTVSQLLRDIDITQPVYMAPYAEEAFARHGWRYQGAWVEYLENKAAALRRRYYLDPLVNRGLVIYGDAEWRDDPSAGPLRACYGGRRISYGAELASLYASAKININIFHVQCVTAPNPRVYDVLASGGFLMTTDCPGLVDEFEPGSDLVVFRSREELLEQVQYYLAHPEERKAIALRGQKRALASCGYHDRMQRLLSAFFDSVGERYVDLCR